MKNQSRVKNKLITIRLDEDLYSMIKSARIDMSKVCREALERSLKKDRRVLKKGSL